MGEWSGCVCSSSTVVDHIKSITGATLLVMVGDGATDLEARQEGGADIFVGFGGIVRRESVLKQADWAVDDFAELTSALD